MVARYVPMAASQVMGLWRNVAGEMETFVAPVNAGTRTPPPAPCHGTWQPEHAAVLGLHAESLMGGADVGHEGRVTEHDALGRSVEPEVYWSMASMSGAMAGSCQRSAKASGISSVASQESWVNVAARRLFSASIMA